MSADYKKLAILILGFAVIFLWFKSESRKPIPAVVVRDKQSSASTLTIPRLSLTAPVVFADSNDEADIQADLESGVTHLQGTAMPGEIGNSYIVGHSSDYRTAPGNYKTVFAHLPDLKPGDDVTVNYQNADLHFKVTGTKIIENTDLSVLSQDTGGKVILTLQTSYPIGTAQKRFIVSAELAK